MVMNRAYIKMLNAQLMEWNTLITLLAEEAENAGPDVKHNYTQEIAEIRRKQRDAVKKVEELEIANGDTWENVKATTDKTFFKLGTGIEQAMVTFK